MSKNMSDWIKLETRPMTEEEKESCNYSEDIQYMYDCELPDDGQTVLVTDKYGHVETDVFYHDEVDGCYFESNCEDGDLIAWMPLPKPYREKGECHDCKHYVEDLFHGSNCRFCWDYSLFEEI